jgi:hypothetical protein
VSAACGPSPSLTRGLFRSVLPVSACVLLTVCGMHCAAASRSRHLHACAAGHASHGGCRQHAPGRQLLAMRSNAALESSDGQRERAIGGAAERGLLEHVRTQIEAHGQRRRRREQRLHVVKAAHCARKERPTSGERAFWLAEASRRREPFLRSLLRLTTPPAGANSVFFFFCWQNILDMP